MGVWSPMFPSLLPVFGFLNRMQNLSEFPKSSQGQCCSFLFPLFLLCVNRTAPIIHRLNLPLCITSVPLCAGRVMISSLCFDSRVG